MQGTDTRDDGPTNDESPKVGGVAALLMPLALFAAFAGLFTAAVLSLGHVMDIPVPCGGGRGCAAVAAHPASKVLGVPIAFIGVAAYVVLILVLLRSGSSKAARILFLVLATIGAIASAGLLVYSQREIQATCLWCAGSGAAMGAMFLLGVVIVRRGAALHPPRPVMVWSFAMLTALAIGLQAGVMQRDANRPPIPAARLATLDAGELIDEAKSLGPAGAPVTIVMFGDPWCPACAAAHEALIAYQRVAPHAVRLVYRHLPLWERSGAAAAVGEVAAEHGKFGPYLAAVYERRVPPVREGYERVLRDLGIDSSGLAARVASADDPAVRRVWRDADLAERLGVTSTPTFVVIIEGRPPMSANQRTLPRILNSPAVLVKIAQAESREPDESP